MPVWLNWEASGDSLPEGLEFNGGGIRNREFLRAGASFEMTSENSDSERVNFFLYCAWL